MTADAEKQEHLAELQSQLENARRLPPEEIAAQIKNTGFQCIRCGECCQGQDNSVLVFPFEIRKILEASGRNWLDEVEPPSEGEWDDCGNFHTLEWRIKKNSDLCKHYSGTCSSPGVCKIYEHRPLLCSTYPFYLDDGKLKCSDCRGLGNIISIEDAKSLALLLIKRHQTEIEEAISLISRYRDFKRGPPSRKALCVVHDSEGEHRITWTEELLRRCGL
jgi:uncharacterized protein